MSHLEQKDFNFHVSNVTSLYSRECFLNTVIECSTANHKRQFFLPIFLLHLTMCILYYSFHKMVVFFERKSDFLCFFKYDYNSFVFDNKNIKKLQIYTFKYIKSTLLINYVSKVPFKVLTEYSGV
jgi:hypothetical protein